MRKRITALLLTFALVFAMFPSSASAAGLENFQRVNTYTGQFEDVASNQWYVKNVEAVYEYGLMTGTTDTTFAPGSHMTLGQAITIAARLHSIYHTGTEEFTQAGGKWYSVYVDYALNHQIISGPYTNYDVKATRLQFADILSKALPSSALSAINTVEANAIPDLPYNDSGAAVYTLYRAGILTGNDEKGTFTPHAPIKRSEVATIVTRMADASLRENLTLKAEPKPATVYWTPNGGKYHRQTCPTLSNSKTVYSGTVSQAGNRAACKVCKP